jgi:dienelactone hydrolase
MASIRWTGEDASSEGARERAFTVDRDGVAVPGVFWHSDIGGVPQPLVLIGHGGGEHKRHDRMVALGTMLARDYGWCAAAIDAPGHGDRGGVSAGDEAYAALWRQDGVVEGMTEDWRATLDMLGQLGEVDSALIGYWGLSQGALFGIPYVASDDRIVAAVLGRAGMSGRGAELCASEPYLAHYAPSVEAPVLFTMQWDDEWFDRPGQFDLFDRIGSDDKRLHAYPGAHGDSAPEALEVQAEFLGRYF